MAQQRASQNASDFAALAGARVIAEKIGGDLTNGTDANVKAAIDQAITLNNATPMLYGAANNGPQYVDKTGAVLGYVNDAAADTSEHRRGEAGSTRVFKPYFLGIIGMNSLDRVDRGHRQGGFSLAGPPPGTLFPVGIAQSFFTTYPQCDGDISTTPGDPCYPQHLTPGNLNVPGGFGWLKFGCDGYGLGQVHPRTSEGVPTPSRSSRARSGHRQTAMDAARQSGLRVAQTRSEAFPETRRAPIARTTSITTSSSPCRSGTSPAAMVRTAGTTSSVSPASN